MIYGIGVDIVQLDRITSALDKNTQRFPEKVLSELEFAEFVKANDKVNFLAKRFAAKEAFSKALGTAFTDGLTMPQITISHTDRGQPIITLADRAKLMVEQQNIRYSHLSLSDERDYVVANVVLEGRVRHKI